MARSQRKHHRPIASKLRTVTHNSKIRRLDSHAEERVANTLCTHSYGAIQLLLRPNQRPGNLAALIMNCFDRTRGGKLKQERSASLFAGLEREFRHAHLPLHSFLPSLKQTPPDLQRFDDPKIGVGALPKAGDRTSKPRYLPRNEVKKSQSLPQQRDGPLSARISVCERERSLPPCASA